MGVAKGGSVGMIGMKRNLVCGRLGFHRVHKPFGEVKRAFVADCKGLHVEERHILSGTFSP